MDDSSSSDNSNSMPGLQDPTNFFGDDDDDDDDDDYNNDNDSATERDNTNIQIPFHRYRYDIHNVPNQLWPILLARTNNQNRFINGIYHKPSGLYCLLRKGLVNVITTQRQNDKSQIANHKSQRGQNDHYNKTK